MASSFIYIIGSSSNPVKIGFAEDVVTRVSCLQVGNPDVLKIHKAFPLDSRLAIEVEGRIHTHFSDKRRRGEWFDVEADDAIEAAKAIVEAAAQNLQDTIERAEVGKDIFARMAYRAHVHEAAREAVDFYISEKKVRRDARAIRTMNGYIRQEVGVPALALFENVFLNQLTIEHVVAGRRTEIERGYALLARAVNALAQFYAHRKMVVSQKLWTMSASVDSHSHSEMLLSETRKRRMASQTDAIKKAS